MTSKLDQLRAYSAVAADTGNFAAIERYRPRDCTTNPSLILQAARQPQYFDLLREALAAANRAGEDVEGVVDRLAVLFGVEFSRLVPGDISTEVPARLSFDQHAMVIRARGLMALYEASGVGPERVLIKLAATWEGIRAAEMLEREGIRTNLTLVFSKEQAIACAQAGVYLISPFVGRITDWHKKARGVDGFSIADDPGVQSVRGIYSHFKRHGYQTVVMGASFRSAAQVEALAGCDRLTINLTLLEQLDADDGPLQRHLIPPPGQVDPADDRLSSATFRWALAENQMASEKLLEGLRVFHRDAQALQAWIEAGVPEISSARQA